MSRVNSVSLISGLACLVFAGIVTWRFVGGPRADCGLVPVSYFSSYTANLLHRLKVPTAGSYNTCILKNPTDWDSGGDIAVTRLTGLTVEEIGARINWKKLGQHCAIADNAIRETFHTAGQTAEMTWDGEPVSCQDGGGLEELVVDNGAAYYVFVDNNDGRVSLYLR